MSANTRPFNNNTLDWADIQDQLDEQGYAVVQRMLCDKSCEALKADYSNDRLYRSTIQMARHSFGKGEYRYYAYPLPSLVAHLRTFLYSGLSQIANDWARHLKLDHCFPDSHDAYIERCHDNAQKRPTPLILKYNVGDYNCLHQDLYGDLVFPLQAALLLDEPEKDFKGGEFILTEQRPRMQSRAAVIPLRKGDMVIFPVNERPVTGKRATYRVKMRHGVSKIRAGHRQALGIIFHDAA